MRIRAIAWLATSVVLASACSGNPPPEGSMGGDPDVITREQIASLNVSTALDVVRRLKPNWLHSRAARGADELVVYVDAARRGGTEALGYVSVEIIEQIRYLSGPDATTRLGTGHRGGAILIQTRR